MSDLSDVLLFHATNSFIVEGATISDLLVKDSSF